MSEGRSGYPAGTTSLALDYAARFSRATGVRLNEAEVCSLLWHPRVAATPSRPPEPVPCGDGALCVDLGPEDLARWEECVAAVFDGDLTQADPEAVAAEAQAWRLPITPYRRPSVPTVQPPTVQPAEGRSVEPRRFDGAMVVEFGAMWAGPLCTALLAAAGATVVKVEPICRLDGLRFGDGDDGTGRAPLYVALNAGKVAAVWDLRRPEDRQRCIDVLLRADVVVSSMSARVLPNLGIDLDVLADSNPALCTMALSAFEPDATEGEWVSYGAGVHAASGLGWDGRKHHRPALSYPDPLAGLLAAARLAEQRAVGGSARLHTSLSEAVAPLVGPSPFACTEEGPRSVEATPVAAMGATS